MSTPKRRLLRRVLALPLLSKVRLAARLWRDRRVPWLAKLLVPALALYLVLPLDLIPDFIPVLGQLDDLLVIGAGSWLFVTLIPSPVLEEHVGLLEGGLG